VDGTRFQPPITTDNLSHAFSGIIPLFCSCFIVEIVDWEALVSLKDVEQTLEKVTNAYHTHPNSTMEVVESSSSTTATATATATSSSTILPVQVDSRLPENQNDEKEISCTSEPAAESKAGTEEPETLEDVDSDAFRIHPLSAEKAAAIPGQSSDEANETETAESNLEDENKAAEATTAIATDESSLVSPAASTVSVTDIPSLKVKYLMDKVCAIFPSAFNFSTDQSVRGSLPFITLQPSFLSATSGEDVLAAFDCIMYTTVHEKSRNFLSHASMSVYSSWLGSIRASSSLALPTTKATIPLYMLLLARFEISVYQSFCVANNKSVKPMVTPNHKALQLGEQAGQGGVAAVVDVQEEAENNSNELKPTGENMDGSSPLVASVSDLDMSEDAPDLLLLLQSVLSRASDLALLEAKKDKAVLREILSPFVEVFLSARHDITFEARLEHLLTTPVVLLGRRLATQEASGQIVLDSWNNALASSLSRVKEQLVNGETESDTMASIDAKTEVSLQGNGEGTKDAAEATETKIEQDWINESATGASETTQKKNHKKKKKKKVCY
jgi:hypothetical protein